MVATPLLSSLHVSTCAMKLFPLGMRTISGTSRFPGNRFGFRFTHSTPYLKASSCFGSWEWGSIYLFIYFSGSEVLSAKLRIVSCYIIEYFPIKRSYGKVSGKETSEEKNRFTINIIKGGLNSVCQSEKNSKDTWSMSKMAAMGTLFGSAASAA